MYTMHNQIGKICIGGLACLLGCSLSLDDSKLFLVSANAVTAPNGTVSFEKSPRLITAHSTFTGVRVRGAIYYFDIELPEDVGEPLQQIVISQRQGQEDIKFRLDKTVAYVGTHRKKKARLNIAAVTQDTTNQAIKIVFDVPISPGTNFTVGIKPKRNPFWSGVYLFGVTAFPAGDKTNGLYLGVGRFHFYSSGYFGDF